MLIIKLLRLTPEFNNTISDALARSLLSSHVTMKKLKYIAPILMGVACFGLQQVKADNFSFDLDSGNSAISGSTGPYARVSINTTGSNTATVTFTSLSNGGNMYLMGGAKAFDLNTNGLATISNVGFFQSPLLVGFQTPSAANINGSGQVDGFGMFNNVNAAMGGFANAFSRVSFTLTKNIGTWANAMSVLIKNGVGEWAAAHIFVATIRADGKVYQSDGAQATGFAGIPDGGTTVMLLGAALGALGIARRFLRI
jgi:hypothetical protein